MTLLVPLGVAIAVLHDVRGLSQGLALGLLSAIGVVGLALAVWGARAARPPGPRRPATFVLCWILGRRAFWRAATEIASVAAHTVLDASSMQTDLRDAWFPLVLGAHFVIGAK